MYGPQNFQQAEAVLAEIKMKKNIHHYSTPQPAIEYTTRYETALLWISDIGLSEKAIIKQFIKGVQPGDFARELILREFKDFKKLKTYFAQTYFENYRLFVKLKASGLLVDDVPKKNAGAAVAAAGANKSSAPAAAAAATRKLTQVPTGALKMSPAKDSKGPVTSPDDIIC